MSPWYILIFLLIAGVTLMLWMNKKSQQTEGFGIFRDMENQFTQAQRSYFHDQADKEILVNPNARLNGINDALNQPDMYLPTSPDRDFNVYFREDNNAFTKQDFELCRGAAHPRNLKRAPRATVGCGWWYVDNPNAPSIGALGRIKEPLDSGLGTQYPGGRWVWSLTEAAKLEDIKKCKRVKSCEAINASGINGECAFCGELGHAVPIDSSGNMKYPDHEDGGCGETAIRNADNCPRPEDIIKEATIGAVDDFEYDVNGNVIEQPPKIVPAVKGVCDPDRSGNLTKDCLVTLATSVGMSPSGATIKTINMESVDGALYKAALQYVTDFAGIPNISGISVDRDTASSVYSRTVQAMNHSVYKVREAAKFLAVGNPNFDICYTEDSEQGPFATDCLQREFRKAGCQLSGKAAPNDSNKGIYDSMSWRDVKDSFKKLFDSTRSTDSGIQDKAIEQCIGTAMYRAKPDICDEPGIEYFVYSRDSSGNPEHFIGRVVSKQGLLPDIAGEQPWASKSSLYLLMKKIDLNATFRMRTFASVRAATSFDVQGWHPSGAVSMKVNNSSIPTNRLQTWSGLDESKWIVPLEMKKRNLIEMMYSSKGGRNIPSVSNYIAENLNLFQLGQSSWKPVIALDFFKGKIEDANGVIQLDTNGKISRVGNRDALVIDQSSTLYFKNGIHSTTIGSICFMFNLADLGNNPDIFKMFGVAKKGQYYMGASADSRSNGAFAAAIMNGSGSDYMFVKDARQSTTLNQWVHYAIVYNADRSGIDLYVNGKRVSTGRGVKPEETILTRIQFGDRGLMGSFAWFHIYDSYLTPQEVLRDMNYENPDYVMPVPAVPDVKMRDYIMRTFVGEDYTGGDYKYMSFPGMDEDTVQQKCADACGSEKQCIAYASVPAWNGSCWLKDTLTPRNRLNISTLQTGHVVKPLSIESLAPSRRCVDVLGFNKGDGAEVATWNCNKLDNQKYLYDDKQRLVARDSGKCLEAENGQTNNGTRVTQRTCSEAEHQKWILDTKQRIHPRHAPNMCMDAYASWQQGGRVGIWECHDGVNQKWKVRDPEQFEPRYGDAQRIKYLPGYPSSGPNKYSTFEEAKQECNKKGDCGGITQWSNQFEMRAGSTPIQSPNNETSWVKQ